MGSPSPAGSLVPQHLGPASCSSPSCGAWICCSLSTRSLTHPDLPLSLLGYELQFFPSQSCHGWTPSFHRGCLCPTLQQRRGCEWLPKARRTSRASRARGLRLQVLEADAEVSSGSCVCVRDSHVHMVKVLGSECVPTQIPVETSPPHIVVAVRGGIFWGVIEPRGCHTHEQFGPHERAGGSSPWAPLALCQVGTRCHGTTPEAQRSPHQTPRVF